MNRGDIYFANLDPTLGSEIKKKRPVLIVSNNANNKVASTITIVPLTSNTSKVYPFEVLLEAVHSGLKKSSKIQCHQIRTISKLRITDNCIGRANNQIMLLVDAALKLHLSLR
jgi:mRNA interferase MazF